MHDEAIDREVASPRLVRIAALIFLQMLPATMLTPAIRPLFHLYYENNEHAMHAFMAINMLGAAIAVPIVGAWAERNRRPQSLIAAMIALDALLLLVMTFPMSTSLLLSIRLCEGAAHVSATALLLAQAAALGRARKEGRVMGVAGAALMFAVAFGSGIGGQILVIDVRAPFLGGALLQLITLSVLLAVPMPSFATAPRERIRPFAFLRDNRALQVPVAAAFVGRFSVGCIVVTFSLFAHRHHGASDRAIGMLFMLLTLPFALSMYPLSRLSDRISRATLMAVGGGLYAVSLLALAVVPFSVLPLIMVVAGASSAALFAPSLCYAACLSGKRKEISMSLINAAGCAGMLLGPACAGITSALVGRVDPVFGYRAVFVLAACSVLTWIVLSGRWLARRRGAEVNPSGDFSSNAI